MHSSPSRSSSVEASPPEVVRRVDIEACRQHVLIAQRGDDTVQLTWVAGGAGGRQGEARGSPEWPRCRRGGRATHLRKVAYDNSLKIQREQLSAEGTCRGSHACQETRRESGWIISASSSPGQGKGGRAFPYLAVSAPFVIKVLISSSWPYLAATWRGVLPYLSAQSISLPRKEKPSA